MGITRARIALVCLVVALSLALVAAPTATAAPPSNALAKLARANTRLASLTTEKRQNIAIARLRTRAAYLGKRLSSAESGVAVLQALAAGLPPILTQLGNGLTALKDATTSGFDQVKAALTAIQTALTDPTTGLAAVNIARPLVGAVVSEAAVSGSQFTVAKASGGGNYILHFERPAGTAADVSARIFEITMVTGAIGFSDAATCTNPAVTPSCDGLLGAKSTSADVLVNTYDKAGAAAKRNFYIAAMTG